PADRDAVRPQPDRRVPRAGGARRPGGLPGRRDRARRRTRRAGALMRYHAEHALLGREVVDDVLIETDGERFSRVTPGVPAPRGARRLRGLTLPGMANAHSHAFHRALRGRAQAARGTFWTWRKQMYEVAERLDPFAYHALARAVYAEMALAGITCVGE